MWLWSSFFEKNKDRISLSEITATYKKIRVSVFKFQDNFTPFTDHAYAMFTPYFIPVHCKFLNTVPWPCFGQFHPTHMTYKVTLAADKVHWTLHLAKQPCKSTDTRCTRHHVAQSLLSSFFNNSNIKEKHLGAAADHVLPLTFGHLYLSSVPPLWFQYVGSVFSVLK